MNKKDFALQVLDNYVRLYIANGYSISDILQRSHLTVNEATFKKVMSGRALLNEADFYSLTDLFRFYDEMENPSAKFPSRMDWFQEQLHWYLVELLCPGFKLIKQNKKISAIFDFPQILINDSTVLIEIGDSLVHIASKDQLKVRDIKREFYSGGSNPAYLLEVERGDQTMKAIGENVSQGSDAQNANFSGATINAPVSINKGSNSTNINWGNVLKMLCKLIKSWKFWVLF